MEKDSGVALELISLTSNIRKRFVEFLIVFVPSWRNLMKEKTHYMLALMLRARFNNLCLMFSFIGRDQGVPIVEQYDIKSLYLMLMKCYYHLHSSIESINRFVN